MVVMAWRKILGIERACLIAALFCDVMMSSPLRVLVHVRVHTCSPRARTGESREPNGPLESQRNGYNTHVLARPTCSEHHVMALSDAKRKKGRPR